jgi:Rieske Fe-S protein
MTAKKTITSRRTFLAALGAGGAAAATVALNTKNADTTRSAQPAAGEANGYRLTEHIRNYYRTTKV